MTRMLSSIALAAMTAGAAMAQNWYVNVNAAPGGNGSSWNAPFQSIQAALTAASAGHTVWVTNGTYGAISRTDNAAITIRSVNGPSVTTIRGTPSTPCAVLGSASGHNATVLSGFTLTNGFSNTGGGVSYGTVNNCIITGNSGTYGGGAYHSILNNCVISGNSVSYNGGGAYRSTLNNCVITGNSAFWGGGADGGTLRNCTVYGNRVLSQQDAGAGVYGDSLSGGSVMVYNSIVWGNTNSLGMVSNYGNLYIFVNSCTAPLLDSSSAVWHIGNIEDDPKFVNAAAGDFRLRSDSPCINAGDNTHVAAGITTDPDGNPRIIGEAVDMGAYEFASLLYVDGANGNDGNNGQSWAAAKRTLQGALTSAVEGGLVVVTNGTYGPITRTTGGVNILIRSVNGPAATIINGNGTQRCATLGSATTHTNIILSGFTLTNGVASSGGGGGSMYGTLNNCTLTDNRAEYGGGAYLGTLNNCILAGNTANQYGGGTYLTTLNNCILAGNTAAQYGGGAASGTLRNCTVWGNTAPQGAGVQNVTAYNSIVWGNTDNGGAAANTGGTCTFANSCTTPPHAGAGNLTADPRLMDAPGGDFRLRLDSPCINAGSNTHVLPGMTADLDGNPRIISGSVDMGAYEIPYPLLYVDIANGSDANSGLTWALAKASIQGALTNATAGWGIAVANGIYAPITRTDNARITIRSVNGPAVTLINGNGAQRCATLGIVAAAQTNIVLSGFTLTNGLASGSGDDANGGGAAFGTLNNCVLSGNTATTHGGASFYSVLNNCTLTGNNGGGAYYGTLNNCLITGNNGYGVAGHLVRLNNCLLTGNTGGGAYQGFLSNCTLSGNSSSWGGGAYQATLTNCVLIGNSAVYGGGAYLGTLVNCLLTGNTADFGGGASAATLVNCTVAGNTSRLPGGSAGVHGASSGNIPLTAYNSIIWGNTDSLGAVVNYGGDFIALTNSCTFPLPPSGAWNIAADPRFVSAATGNFRLSYGSPCVDAGNALHGPAGGIPDLDGNPRIIGQTVDMGAYEVPYQMLYVNGTTGDDGRNGRSWATAKKSIQGALTNATPGWAIVVTNGTYAPITRTDNTGIIIQSLNGPTVTLINGNGATRCATLGSATGHASIVLSGFTLTNGNSGVANGGGALYGTLDNCILAGNRAASGGGAYGTTLNTCLLTGNTATLYGGGAYAGTLRNCTVAGNTAQDGAGVFGTSSPGMALTAYNSIVWGNTNSLGTVLNHEGTCFFTHSCTAPAPGGTGNTAADPHFTDAPGRDFRLRLGSPCANTGSNAHVLPGMTTDLDGNLRIIGGNVDMGAYENNAPLLYVDATDGHDLYNGLTWATARKTIQSALDDAATGWVIVVKDGTYAPISKAGDPSIIIQSLNGPAATLINGNGTDRCATLGSQPTHTNIILSGFTLTNGNATVSSPGGANGGGALYGTLNNCTLTGNTALNGGGAYGSTLTDCTLTGNTAFISGGGAYLSTLNNCTLTGNTAAQYGGGAYGGTLDTCLLTGNTATLYGGGAYGGTLRNCTVWGNTAQQEGAGVSGWSGLPLTAYNSIIWGNTNSLGTVANYTSTCTFTNSCTYPLPPTGTGNTADDPRFVDAAKGDLRLSLISPCINTGDNDHLLPGMTADLDGNPRITGGTVDMGAYEIPRQLLYVDGTSGDDGRNGLAWATAKRSIQSALTSASSGWAIVVTNGTYASISKTGNPDILIQSLNGPAVTLIRASGSQRCATLGSTLGDTSIALSGFTLTNGNISANGGGALYGTLSNCILTGNRAQFGGGAYGSVLNTCLITANTADWGGGGAYGGILRNCTVWGNTAQSGAGGVHGTSTPAFPLTAYNSIVWGNTTSGGSVANYAGNSCTFTDSCTFPFPGGTGNIADDPKFTDAPGRDFRLRLDSPCVNTGNNAHIIPGMTADLDGNPRITGQTVDMGAYEFASSLFYVDSASGNDLYNGQTWATARKTIQSALGDAATGSAILVKDGTYGPISKAGNPSILIQSVNGPSATRINGNGTDRCATLGYQLGDTSIILSGFTLTNGLAGGWTGYDGWGGGALYGTLTNCTLTGNTALNGGGAYGSTLTDCTLTGNTAASYGGGAAEATLNNCTLTGNTASYGGGAYYGTLNNCTLSGNTANFFGGGAYYGTLNNCTLTGNTAALNGGGAYYGTLTGCTLTGNTAANNGGGAAEATLNNCTLSGNTADWGGGGAYGGTLNNCLITGNTANQGGGGGAAEATLRNCTVWGNTAPSGGAGIYGVSVGPARAYNSIVWGNTNSIGALANYDGDCTFTNSCTSPGPGGTGNTASDPRFISAATGNFRLQAGSPCIDTGNDAYLLLPVMALDLDGNPRIRGLRVDMGAYEADPTQQAPTHTTTTGVPVPYTWLDDYLGWKSITDYEDLGNLPGANGLFFWESYVAGLIPTDPTSKFLITNFVVNAQSRVTALDWTPRRTDRVYTIYGKTNLTDTTPWFTPTNSGTRFFKVEVRLE